MIQTQMSSTTRSGRNLLSTLKHTLDMLETEFARIPDVRKEVLKKLTQYIQNKIEAGNTVCLIFICTHNSRRSHIAQLWAQTAAWYYEIDNVKCFSGGTETTAFNPRAVKAMQQAGFDIFKIMEGINPVYEVRFSTNADPISAFSKRYDDPFNPNQNFAAIMTCSDASENCPLVQGASDRITITYDDPKNFDDTPQEADRYAERVKQIGLEMLFTFSQVRIR